MKWLLLPVATLLIFLSQGSNSSANTPAHFSGAVLLFGENVPLDTHVRARIAGAICGEGAITQREGGSDSVFELQADCGAEGQEVEFEWYRADPAIATTCTPTSEYRADEDTNVDLRCGVDDEFSATWMVENTTGETQPAVYVRPAVLLGYLWPAEQPSACGHASVEATFFLSNYTKVVWPAPCVEPGDIVRFSMSTDCPCHSELEIVYVDWLADNITLRSDIDCDQDVDDGDVMLALFFAAELGPTPDLGCPEVGSIPERPDDLEIAWGDLNCDGIIDALDALGLLRAASGNLADDPAANCPWS